jgi:radical SAM superfamily enzyme YgiQ (UPF0313 family)
MTIAVKNRRKILCAFPAYAPSFGTFEYAYALRGRTRAFMPPQGILVLAAYLPSTWEVRFVDENMRRVTDDDLRWADAVFVSGMHVQRNNMIEIARRARRAGKTTVLGGPSVSATPEAYGMFDYLHVGELGDATDELISRLDNDSARPPEQVVLQTRERVPLSAFPTPAYHLIDLDRYFLGSIQFSSGCPYQCEFCDIPVLYGRLPRLKTPQQVTHELDVMLRNGNPGAVYFVDDNFIGNRKAARELLPHLIDWQKRNAYPLEFACEATLNIARDKELLAMMREAFFCTVFCGIETPDSDALHAMSKGQNTMVPMMDAIRTLNGYGIEVVAGIIMGLDTDQYDTAHQILDFIELSQIPMLTINLLQALPKTPLWTRLEAEGRLIHDERRESNVVFALPYEQVLESWRQCIGAAYEPEALYRRFAHNLRHTYPNRIKPPADGRATWANMRKGMRILANLLVHEGVLADYRGTFWRHALPLLRSGRIEDLIHIGLVGHHLIAFTRAALAGQHNASFYSTKVRTGETVTAGG